MKAVKTLSAASLVIFCSAIALAQDPVKVDPKHYKLVTENDKVRVLRITYGPKEKSVMHDHPGSVAVLLTDQNVRFHTPDGKSEVVTAKAKEAIWSLAGKHLPENLSEKPLEGILVELKGKPAAAPAPPKAPPKKQ